MISMAEEKQDKFIFPKHIRNWNRFPHSVSSKYQVVLTLKQSSEANRYNQIGNLSPLTMNQLLFGQESLKNEESRANYFEYDE